MIKRIRPGRDSERSVVDPNGAEAEVASASRRIPLLDSLFNHVRFRGAAIRIIPNPILSTHAPPLHPPSCKVHATISPQRNLFLHGTCTRRPEERVGLDFYAKNSCIFTQSRLLNAGISRAREVSFGLCSTHGCAGGYRASTSHQAPGAS